MRYIARVLVYLRPYRRLAAASVLLTIAVAALGLLAPWPLKILFDSVLGQHPIPDAFAPLLAPLADDRGALLIAIVLGGLAITLVANGLKVVASQVETRLSQGMILDFRSDLFQHAQRLSMAYHDKRRSGGLIFAINFQADAAAGLVMTLSPLAQSALTLVGMFWITYLMNARLALVSLMIIPVLYWAVGWYMTRIQERLRRVKGLEGESLSIIHEAISMIKVIVAFGREGEQHRRFREQGERAVEERVKVTVRQTAFSLLVNTTTAIGTALVLGYGVSLILRGELTSGELLVVLAYVASIYSPLSALSTTIGSLQDRFTSLEVAFDLLDTVPEVRDRPGAVAIAETSGRIDFEDVAFCYDDRRPTLEAISFAAEPGQTIGIVGPTGAGKSTLVSLIPRFYDPGSGAIRLDGRDVRDFTLASLRRQVSLVLQEPLLFSGTIEENIRFARLGATHEEIVEAAKAANAHDFVMRLPRQYATVIGERGAMLSGGERQRISVARAFIKGAPILILDEPTSAIDSRTEAVILEALERLMRGRTTFLIAHRLSTLRRADLILVMHGGKIVGRGTHDELMGRNGLYKELWMLQANSMSEPRREPGVLAPSGAIA